MEMYLVSSKNESIMPTNTQLLAEYNSLVPKTKRLKSWSQSKAKLQARIASLKGKDETETSEDTVVSNHDITPDLHLDGPSIHDVADIRATVEICEIPVDLEAKFNPRHKPFQRKYYYLPEGITHTDTFLKAPKQVRDIIRYMSTHPEPQLGREIVANAIADGYVQSVIDPGVLFAYYSSKLRELGVRFTYAPILTIANVQANVD